MTLGVLSHLSRLYQRAAAPPAVDFRLRKALRLFVFEPTSLCNLKCTYCSVSQPGYRGVRSKLSEDEVIALADSTGCSTLQLSLHGETTMLPGWEVLAERLLDKGYQLRMLSNLSRIYSAREIATLARIELTVSIDTVDEVLFAKLRRGAELNRLLTNVVRIHSERRKRGLTTTTQWNAVLCCEILEGLVDHAQLGLELGVSAFYYCALREFGDVGPVTSLARANPEQRALAHRNLSTIIELFDQNKTPYHLTGSDLSPAEILSELHGAEGQHTAAARVSHPFEAAPVKNYFIVPEPGMTRDCTDPWNKAVVHADQAVGLCEGMGPIGSLKEQSLDEILSGPEAERYRTGLATGNLMPYCQTCPKRKPIAVSDFARKLAAL